MSITLARKSLLMSGAKPFSYLLRDEFTSEDLAPITDPRTCEPGPGSLDFTDAGGIISIPTPGTLSISGTASGNTGYISGAFSGRVVGTAFLWRFGNGANLGIHRYGLHTTFGSTLTHGVRVRAVEDTAVTPDLLSVTYPKNIVIILRSTGSFVLEDGNLLWVSRAFNTAGLKMDHWFSSGQAPSLTVNKLLCSVLDNWDSDTVALTSIAASPSSGDTATMEADGTVEVNWTPQSGDVLDIMIRRVDDDNCLIVRCDQAGTIRTYRKLSGTETLIDGGGGSATAQTWTAGTDYRITIRAVGTVIKNYVNCAGRNVTAAETNFATATGVKLSGDGALSLLYCWKYNMAASLPSQFKPSGVYRYFWSVGDSKTVNSVWQNAFINLVSSGSTAWVQSSPAHATVGWETITVRANIDAALAAIPANPAPEFVAYNLGTNDTNGDSGDVLADGTGATWTANTQYIIDAIHTKWTACHVYIMCSPWKPDDLSAGFLAKFNLMAGTLIPNAIAGRSWAHLGPDERDFLENGDDGATYISVDRLHPNSAGYSLTAQKWAQSFGLI